jgi:hypothetical protein
MSEIENKQALRVFIIDDEPPARNRLHGPGGGRGSGEWPGSTG